ncbi:uncharacterized protein LOC116239763 isoform X3 [Phasianus colchicus]|uniref:uncharacterized protein LOC116239763 isoform X3 n=1 Tax=Phasianus colchicus TaxID=9054 RepID=UPI00129E3628|nr:uncharacterized protein LOC116239763 isoform X3 [Phasianus colchicus]
MVDGSSLYPCYPYPSLWPHVPGGRNLPAHRDPKPTGRGDTRVGVTCGWGTHGWVSRGQLCGTPQERNCAMSMCLQAGRRRLRWRRWWRRAVAPEPGAERQAAKHSSSQCKPWCPCSKANQELQQLVLSGLPGHRSVLDPDFWQAAWRDLEELVKQNSLSCHCCSSSEGQAEAQGHPRKRQQHYQGQPKESAKIPLPLCSAPKETERPMARAALPGPAEAARLKDNSSQMGASDLRVADIKAISRQHHRAVPDNISKLQLSQVTCGKLSMHTDRKCLELKFQLLRTSARRPTELLQNLQPTQAEPVSAPKRMCLLHPDQDRRQQRGAKAPGSRLVPMYFYSCEARFLTEEERETLELHIRSMKLKHLGNSLISGHPLQSAASWEKESTSTYVTAPSEASWAEAGPKGHKWWSWWKK